MKRPVLYLLLVIPLALAVIYVFSGTRVMSVKGRSMELTFQVGDYLVMTRAGNPGQTLNRGDVVVFHVETGFGTNVYIKRVLGLPGETLEIKNGEVLIDGEPVREEYVEQPAMTDYAQVTIPADSCFVLGDNRNQSDDSRGTIGFVPLDGIKGRVWARLWPLKDIGLFPPVKY